MDLECYEALVFSSSASSEEDDVTGICPPAMNSAIVGRTMWSCSSELSGGEKVSTSVQTEEEVGAAISEDNLKSLCWVP